MTMKLLWQIETNPVQYCNLKTYIMVIHTWYNNYMIIIYCKTNLMFIVLKVHKLNGIRFVR